MNESAWVGKTLLGRYQMRQLLGLGGMAEVYQGYDPNLSRVVAIKLIHPYLASDPGFLARFEREAQAIARLRHPNIVQVYDFNHEGEVYFMVMEYVEGPTLQSHLKTLAEQGQRMPLPQAVDVMIKLAGAMHYAHTSGMVHRDLKPSNILFSTRSEPVITDFGLARILGGASFTATGAVMGTPLYMSPEQSKGEGGGESSDIYSLGVILYEIATGTVPFTADTPLSVMMKHISDPLPSPLERNPSMPPLLAEVIQTALAKDPANRFKTAEAMATALTLVKSRLGSARPPVQPQPPPRADRTQLESPPQGTQIEAGTMHERPQASSTQPRVSLYPAPPPRPPAAPPPVLARSSAPAPLAVPAQMAVGASAAPPAANKRSFGMIGIAAAAVIAVICVAAVIVGALVVPGLLPGLLPGAGPTAAPTTAGNPTPGGVSLPEGVLFQDSFLDPGSGWPSFSTDVTKAGYHPPDAYHLEISGDPAIIWSFRQQSFGDFSAETEVYTESADGEWRHGLGFRETGEGSFYAFLINPNAQTWQVIKYDQGDEQTLAEGSDDSIVSEPKAVNVLRVDAQGGNFVFSINGHGVGAAEETNLREGNIGFVLETTSGRAHIHWDSITISQYDANGVPVVTAATNTPGPTGEPATEAPIATIAATLPSNVPDGMVEVPAGPFLRGQNGGADYQPERTITLKRYFIDATEVTNQQFADFVNATGYVSFFEGLGRTTNTWRAPGGVSVDNLLDHPVVFVVWDDANAYCQWAGKRLPTEAEWEKAARGPDGNIFPWGNDFDPARANTALNPSAPGSTAPVGSFPDGASVYGALDMSGNVWEFTSDQYSASYFGASPDVDPTGPTDGFDHVTRGGGWRNNNPLHVSSVFRDHSTVDFGDDMSGFRCAQDAP